MKLGGGAETTPEPEAGEWPGLAIVLVLAGGAAILVSAGSALLALADDSPARGVALGLSGSVGGLMLCAFGYALAKICQIEAHLRPRLAAK